ncbi:hypothetical protein L0V05_05475 [Tabrizicola sp. J26]|uniref:Ppx/GppA phosphatase family protein n=1 Tax=Alitabrizicola rongguiensis TaxID=2909234 RepID=UPI001F2B5F4A|nr:hypothetical protein [Tabrizicola rongguiensis]MCF1708267.1 hypothetical protein [Tabrizicola rongguiensis]
MTGQPSRWEWRSFGDRFDEADRKLATLAKSPVHVSDEIYIWSEAGGNVKIRDELLDIKVLRQVDAHGLEQWSPVLKATFPLDASALDVLSAALGPRVTLPEQDRLSLDGLLSVLQSQTGKVRVVSVHKRRVRYSVEGCMAELSDVVADGRSTRTIAVESTDADAVLRGVAWLGLAGYENISYPRWLAALASGAPETWAVIDVGTNSVKFHIGTQDATGRWRSIVDRAEVTRLGEGLAQSGCIGEAPLERTIAAIGGMAKEARRHGAKAIFSVGTAGLRQASNAGTAVEAIRDQTGIAVEVISGEQEARLAFLAATSGLAKATGRTVVFDTGGGSSQFTFGHGSIVDERFSLNVGAARYTEAFGLDGHVDAEQLKAALAAIAADLARLGDRPAPDHLIGMGGAITNMTAVHLGLTSYDPEKVQGTVLDLAEVDRQVDLFSRLDASQRRSVPGLQPARAEVILAGACIVKSVMETLSCERLVVSDRGLRHGVLQDRFG